MGCDKTEDSFHPNGISDSIEIKAVETRYKNNLASDPLLQDYLNSFLVLSSFELNSNVDLSKMQSDFASISSEDDYKNKVKLYFKKPDEFIHKAYEAYKLSQRFWTNNQDLKRLNSVQKQQVIEHAVLKIFKDKKNHENHVNLADQCATQRAADEQTCFEASMVGAAGCGLLSPTLLGALGCGVFVIAADATCYRAAERDYNICKQSA